MSSSTTLRLIGYWHSEYDATPWPDPTGFVDPDWDTAERETVVDHLVRGRALVQYRGLSPCRFCGIHNGSKFLTDSAYSWPEGLAHYLTEHAVRLPGEFVSHVAAHTTSATKSWGPRPDFDELGQRARGGGYDDEYVAWIARLRQPDSPARAQANWLDADISREWWLSQRNLRAKPGRGDD